MREPIRKRAHTQFVRDTQLAEQLWIDPGVKSGISVRELISTKKKKKEKIARRECKVEQSPDILASAEKATTTILRRRDKHS